MGLPQFSMRELIDAGVHFGHKTKRWNPKMQPFLYGVRNGVHIIDLQQTVPLLHQALTIVREVVAKNGRVLFVGTKHQAMEPIAEAAKRCGQYYINRRWLGGMLTNWQTIQASIKKLRKYEELLAKKDEKTGLTKKEMLNLEREYAKLEKSLGGIKDMGGLPDLIFIIDTNKEDLAIKEAAALGIPVVAILDSNSTPDGIAYPIPGNDDATRAIRLYCRLLSDAALDGLQQSVHASGRDIGASEDPTKIESAATAEEGREEESKGKRRDHKGDKGKKEKAAPVVVKKAPGKLKETEGEPAAQAAGEAEASEDKAEGEEKKSSKKSAPKTKKK
jgi:small subunit ribosomal protein S2